MKVKNDDPNALILLDLAYLQAINQGFVWQLFGFVERTEIRETNMKMYRINNQFFSGIFVGKRKLDFKTDLWN